MTKTEQARSRISACLSLYREVGIVDYTLKTHPDFPGKWLLHLKVEVPTEEVIQSLRAIWPICSKEWPGLTGIKINNLKTLNADAFSILNR
ncbi:MAG: hypothetical protein EBZ77_01830 [Chitinophagia bacterium]|nr:hypothetical protein [Chitinophagia bacterium]